MLNVIMHVLSYLKKCGGKLCLPYKVVGKRPNELSDSYHNIFFFIKKKQTSVIHWVLCIIVNCILNKRWQKSLDNWSRLISRDYVHYGDNLGSFN